MGKVKSVQGITGSKRPCVSSDCPGELRAELHKYHDGSFRLVWRCTVCYLNAEFGETTAITKEPQNTREALN